MMMKTKKTEYKVKYVRKDRQWQVMHVHCYPNYYHEHQLYQGSSWNMCMWVATGDSAYLDKIDLDDAWYFEDCCFSVHAIKGRRFDNEH